MKNFIRNSYKLFFENYKAIEFAMEELKSINGSEQFVLKDSRNSFRRDEKGNFFDLSNI